METKSKAEQEEQEDVEYDKAFDSISEGKKPEDTNPETKAKVGSEDKQEGNQGTELAHKPEVTPDEGSGEGSEQVSAPEPEKESQKGLEKALKDTKSWATKVSQENAELKKKILEFESGRATSKDVSDAKDALAASKDELSKVAERVYADYPELKELLDPLLKMTSEVNSEMKNLKKTSDEEKRRAELRANFEKNVEPEVLKVHSDFSTIKTDDEYFEWAEKQRPALRYAAMYSLDPQDIIEAVTAYKQFKGSPEASKKKAEDDKRKQVMRDNLSSVRGDGSETVSRTAGKKGDENDYDTAFEEAANKIRK